MQAMIAQMMTAANEKTRIVVPTIRRTVRGQGSELAYPNCCNSSSGGFRINRQPRLVLPLSVVLWRTSTLIQGELTGARIGRIESKEPSATGRLTMRRSPPADQSTTQPSKAGAFGSPLVMSTACLLVFRRGVDLFSLVGRLSSCMTGSA